MKSIRLSLSFFLFCFTHYLVAQSFFGIEGGAYFFNSRGDIKVGITSEHPLKKYLSIQPEIVYIRKMTPLPTEHLNLNDDDNIVTLVSYIQATITSRIKLEIDNISIQLFAGPYFAYGIKPVLKNNAPFRNFSFDDLRTRRLDLGGSIGAGLSILVPGNKKMFVDYRFNIGLVDLDKKNDQSLYNEGSSFTMGFLLPLKKNKETIEKS